MAALPRRLMAAACCRSSFRFAQVLSGHYLSRDVRVQAAAGRITVIAAAGINAACAADVVASCRTHSMQLPVPASPVWIHMSGSALVPTAADPALVYTAPFKCSPLA